MNAEVPSEADFWLLSFAYVLGAISVVCAVYVIWPHKHRELSLEIAAEVVATEEDKDAVNWIIARNIKACAHNKGILDSIGIVAMVGFGSAVTSMVCYAVLWIIHFFW